MSAGLKRLAITAMKAKTRCVGGVDDLRSRQLNQERNKNLDPFSSKVNGR